MTVKIEKALGGYIAEDLDIDDPSPKEIFTNFADLVDWLYRYFDEDKKAKAP